MNDVRVLVHFDAPRERVFQAVSDHEKLLQGGGTTTRVVRAGKPVRNGLGCVRDVRAPGGVHFREEITAWEPPGMFEYVIRDAPIRARHERARLSFTPRGSGTDVEWTSRFELAVPVLGGVLGAVAAKVFAELFTGFLVAARTRLEEGA